ncbi:hypothetical protein NA78x_000839 [Anatilimnocola sp. NA78]|uniref:hypothetical protein n=1 Tax=Anatilimnocola sp. NA78 TaxID=3415683 RepID=UPI003CE5B635
MDPNPYASPAGPNEQPDPGIGSWRDGRYLVMHMNAELPHYCITTGEAADGARELVLSWRAPGDLLSRTHQFWLPQARKYRLEYARQKGISKLGLGLMGLVPITVVFGIPALLNVVPDGRQDVWVALLMILTLLVGLAGMALWLRALFTARPPLKHVNSWRDYVWFEGAHPNFLAHLPQWPAESR